MKAKHIFRSILSHIIWVVGFPFMLVSVIGMGTAWIGKKLQTLNNKMRNKLA